MQQTGKHPPQAPEVQDDSLVVRVKPTECMSCDVGCDYEF